MSEESVENKNTPKPAPPPQPTPNTTEIREGGGANIPIKPEPNTTAIKQGANPPENAKKLTMEDIKGSM